MSSSTSKPPAIMPCRTIQGHTKRVQGVVHLPGKRRIITCSDDSSLRLWDLESGTQIGKDWQDEGDKEGVRTIALSPSGKTVTTGSDDGTVRLWNVETGKVVAKWALHTESVLSVCWSAGGKRVLSGSSDGTARVCVGGDLLARPNNICDRRLQTKRNKSLGCEDRRPCCHTQTRSNSFQPDVDIRWKETHLHIVWPNCHIRHSHMARNCHP